MENLRKHKYTLLLGFLSVLLTAIVSCTDESTLGTEILPTDDLISVENVVIQDEISSFTFTEEGIKTDESSKSLLGIFNDPVFGKSEISFASQFRLQSYYDFGTNPVADSVKLVVRYRTIYGDTLSTQRFSVYEMESSIPIDSVFDQSIDLKTMAYDDLLGELDYRPRVALDSTGADTLQQIFSIPLDISLGEKLISADSTIRVNNDSLLAFFKGLYVESELIDGSEGTIISLDAVTNSSGLGTGLVVYYNNDENKVLQENPNSEEKPDTLFVPFLISGFSGRVNNMVHDYSSTAFYSNLNSDQNEDSLIYVQSTGGLNSKILIDNLTSWQDSTDIGVNKAELIFQVDTIASDVHNYPPPSQLLFIVVDENGNEFLPQDYYFSPAYYGGGLQEDYTYKFNITQHLQRIIDNKAQNYGFFLTTANKSSEANRVVLKGARSKTGIKLIVTYTKFSR